MLSRVFSLLLVTTLFIACGTDSGSAIQYENEVIETPTQGLITTVKEVRENEFKIKDEVTVP
ncbi:MAG: hypothetical protein AAF738_09760, partial [Bacteroidota bacterium]